MKKLSDAEREELRKKLEEYHTERAMNVARDVDRRMDSENRRWGAIRTGNPTLNSRTFAGFEPLTAAKDTMSVSGTVNKVAILLAITLISATWMWILSYGLASIEAVFPFLLIGSVAGLAVGIVTTYKKDWASATAPIYAILEGFVLGGLSVILEARFPGIVIQAVGLTFGTLICLLVLYKSGMIKATANFRMGVISATGGIAIVYIATLLLDLFGVPVSFIHDAGPMGVIFSLFVVVIAALNLVLDFDLIEKGADNGAPKYMEWYAAFGLMVTLIWLYLEILRLLAKLRRRR